MADRISQYGMVPGFPPNMMQHHQLNQAMQQQQQQQQSGQQQDAQQHHPMGGFSDQNRVWQQMHQMRAQNGPDMGSPQVQQQMADLLRSQNLARVQSQQQHQFGMGAGPMGGGTVPGQQSFLDQNQQPQHNMSIGFSNLAQNSSFQQSMQNRQTMLQALQGNQGHNRQLELMGLAQNQQNQNGPINLGNRGVMSQPGGMGMGGGPQGLNPSQAQNDIFSSSPMNNDGMRRPSPSHPPPPSALGNQPQPGPGMPQNGQRPQTFNLQGRTINITDLTERATSLHSMIGTQEFQMRQLQAQRAGMPDTVFLNKMQSFKAEIHTRKESLNKIMTLINLYKQNNGSLNGINPPNMPPQQPGPNTGNQGWMGQSNPLQPSFGNTPTQPSNQSQSQPPGPGQRSSPSLLSSQASQHMNSSMSPNPAARPGPTPQLNAPFPNPMSSHLHFPMHNSQQGGPNMGAVAGGVALNLPTSFPALEKSRFESSYKQWCLTKSIVHDPRLLLIDNRQIDLYQLHTQVMREGGLMNVQSKDLWPVIAARMGWVHLPATATEPSKSGPAAGTHLAHVYKEYLAGFDAVYMASVVDNRRKQIQSMAQQQSGNFPINPNQMPPGMKPGMNSTQMRLLVACADKSVAELRQRGMTESMIVFIENNRTHLQQMAGDQSTFRGTIRTNPGMAGQSHPGEGEPQGGGMPNQSTFAGSSQQHPSGSGPVQPGNATSSQFPQGQNGVYPPKGANPIDNHPPPQNGPGPPRPNRAQVIMAHQAITRVKAEFASRTLPAMPSLDVPSEQRMTYNTVLDQVNRVAADLDNVLAIYQILTKSEDSTRRLLTMIATAQHQRALLASANPKFIVSLDTLQLFLKQLVSAWQHISNTVHNAMKGEHPSQNLPPGPPNNGPPGAIASRPSHLNSMPQPSPQPALLNSHTQPLPPTSLNRPMSLNPPPPPGKRKIANPGGSGVVSTPTPPASASTPVASAPTPTHAASPQTPKSPKGKAPAKSKAPVKRKVSKPNAPNATPTSEPAQIPTPATNGVKRARDEDTVPSPQNAGTPSGIGPTSANDAAVASEASPPKRAKTEWEGPPSETLKRKNEEVENIKTEEDASQFLEKMTELIKMSAGDDSQTSLSQDISDTLEQLLKGCGSLPDLDGSSGLSAFGLGEGSSGSSSLEPNASTSQLPMNNDFAEFFDFSSFTGVEDEDDSKAETPDLIPSSSTNPSPESQSGSEADPAHHASTLLDVKQEEFDPLRLGTLKEVDGGESAYYQSTDWKWDGPMTTQEQPWPIFHS